MVKEQRLLIILGEIIWQNFHSAFVKYVIKNVQTDQSQCSHWEIEPTWDVREHRHMMCQLGESDCACERERE